MRKIITSLLLTLSLTTLVNAQEFTRMPSGVDYLNPNSYTDLTSKSYKVEGKPDIESFFLALCPCINNYFSNVKQIKEDLANHDHIFMDKKNGYISFSEEGAGSIHVQCCYWNTKQKQKMVALYYDSHDFYQKEGQDKELIANSSYLAFFLYNEKNKTLEFIESPIKEKLEMPKEQDTSDIKSENESNNSGEYQPPVTPVHFLCELPKQGKNIKYRFGREEDENKEWHTLTYDGIFFEEEKKSTKTVAAANKLPTPVKDLVSAVKKENLDMCKYFIKDVDSDGIAEVFVADEDGTEMVLAYSDGKYNVLARTDTGEENIFYTEDGFIGNVGQMPESYTIVSFRIKGGKIVDQSLFDSETDDEGNTISKKYYVGKDFKKEVDEVTYKKSAPQKQQIIVREQQGWIKYNK